MSSIFKIGSNHPCLHKRDRDFEEERATDAKIQRVVTCIQDEAGMAVSSCESATENLLPQRVLSSSSFLKKNKSLDSQLLDFQTSPHELYAIPLAQFLRVIQEYPEEPAPYFNLAKTTYSNDQVTVINRARLTPMDLLQKSMELLPEDELISLAYANALKYFSLGLSEDPLLNELQEKLYLKIMATHSDPRKLYTQLALVRKYHVDLEQIHELSFNQKLSNKELLFKAIEENAQDDEAYLALALGSYNLGQAIIMPDGMIACWKHLLLQALDINPNNPLTLLSLVWLMPASNQLALDERLLDPKNSLSREAYDTLRLDPNSLTYTEASPLTSKVTLFNGKVVDQADVIIELHAVDQTFFFAALHMLNSELIQEKEFNRVIKKILAISRDLSTQWNLVFATLEYLICGCSSDEKSDQLLLWIEKHYEAALDKKIFSIHCGKTEGFYASHASFDVICQTPVQDLLKAIKENRFHSALYVNLARKFDELGYESSNSLHQFGYKDINQLLFTAIKLDPKNSYAYYYLSQINDSNISDMKGKFYLMAIHLNPEEGAFYSGLAKNVRGSITFFNQTKMSQHQLLIHALSLNPNDDIAYTYLGRIARKQAISISSDEKLTEKKCYLKALELNPRNQQAYVLLFTVLNKAYEDNPMAADESILVNQKKMALEDLLFTACQIHPRLFSELIRYSRIYLSKKYLKFLEKLEHSTLPRAFKRGIYIRTQDFFKFFVGPDYETHEADNYVHLIKKIFSFFRHEEQMSLSHQVKKEYLIETYGNFLSHKRQIPYALELIQQLEPFEQMTLNYSSNVFVNKKEFILARISQLDHHPLAYTALADQLGDNEKVKIEEQQFSKRELYLEAIRKIPAQTPYTPMDLGYYAISYSSLANHLDGDEDVVISDNVWSRRKLCLKALELDHECALAYHVLAKNFQSPLQIQHIPYHSAQQLYLQAIKVTPHHPIPYYELGRTLKASEAVLLPDHHRYSQRQLYIRAIQLGIQDPHAYYQMGIMMSDQDQIYFPYNREKRLSKVNVLARALELEPSSHFYLYKLVDYLYDQIQKKISAV
ncbi:MAG: hypothetical protein QRY72_01580 [Candidatus Rhabdochlamydia sp.]